MQQIFSAGHGQRSFADFMDLLLTVDYELLVDVRSRPRSRFPWFNKAQFDNFLGDKYLWLPSLGGLDKNLTEEQFQEGLSRLTDLAKVKRVVLLCSEKDFKRCHRHTKLEPELRLRGFNIVHL